MRQLLTMSSLCTKLAELGFTEDFVKINGLPDWWDDELNDKPLAVLEGAGYIAENLKIDLRSLLVAEEKIRFAAN